MKCTTISCILIAVAANCPLSALESDDFDGPMFDQSLWSTMNGAALLQSPNDLFHENGELHIGVSRTQSGNDHDWYHESEGFLMYQEHAGVFDVRARVRVRDWDNPSVGPQVGYAFGGLMVRNPDTQDYMFVVIGNRGGDSQIETKVTNYPQSWPRGITWNGHQAQLRIVRDSFGVVTLYARDYNSSDASDSDWQEMPLHAFAGTADLGSVTATHLQIGICAYGYQHYDDFRSVIDHFEAVGSQSNRAPIADSQELVTSEDEPRAVMLTAIDADNDTLTYTVIVGPQNGSLSGTAPDIIYTPNDNFNGSDSFTFTANDGIADSGVGTISLTVTPVNDSPTVNAGADAQVILPALAVLNGVASDVDGDALTATWSKISGPGSVEFDDPGVVNTTASFSTQGTYTLRLMVDDGFISAFDDAIVTVQATNPAPTRVVTIQIQTDGEPAVADASVDESVWIALDASGSVVFSGLTLTTQTIRFRPPVSSFELILSSG